MLMTHENWSGNYYFSFIAVEENTRSTLGKENLWFLFFLERSSITKSTLFPITMEEINRFSHGEM